MRHFLVNLAIIGQLSLAFTALGAVVATAPAFNGELRQAGAFDAKILPFGPAMYHHSTYLYQQAATFIRADLIPFGDGETAPLVAPLELAEKRAAEAAALAGESLARDPGNAGAWTVLAWASLLQGDPASARDALNRSWELAPYSLTLSEERMALVLALFDASLYAENAPSMTDAEQAAFFKDFETIRVQRRSFLRGYIEEASATGLPVPDFEIGQ